MIDYLLFRIFHFFNKKDPQLASERTANFMAILLGSLVVPIFIIFNLISGRDLIPKTSSKDIKYLIGIPLALILMFFCNRLVKGRLTNIRLDELRNLYDRPNQKISIWLIFFIPIFNMFIVPIIYGLLNGTIRFPLLYK